jgi:glycosyltransferase involved in cell wall biosynthesis
MFKRALKFVHFHIWRRLPHGARRAVLFRVARWWAPAVSSDARSTGPIIVVGMLRHASGLGAAARACHDALKAAGVPVAGIDLTARLLHEENHPDFAFDDGRELAGEGLVLLHVSGPLVPLALAYLGRAFVRHKRIVAHWFWELPEVPKDWLAAIPFIHEIWVNTRFVRDAVQPIARGRPVHVVPYPLALEAPPPPGESNRAFTALVVLNIASSFARKNPCAAIAAFRMAFGNDPSTRLIVKYMNAFAWPDGVRLMEQAAAGADNIELTGGVFDQAEMHALYHQADVVISPHRSEGLGLVIAEAMLRGLPVIATDWSGSVDFLTHDIGIPVSYDLVPVIDPQGNYAGAGMRWAEIRVDEVAAALQELRADRQWGHRLGSAAAVAAAAFFCPARYVDHVIESVDGLSDAMAVDRRKSKEPGQRP